MKKLNPIELSLTVLLILSSYITVFSQSAPGGIDTDLRLWLKADQLAPSLPNHEEPVSQWHDVSGNSRHHEEVTAATRPIFISNETDLMNFHPSVRFSATGHRLRAATQGWINDAVHVFYVSITESQNATRRAVYSFSPNTTSGIYMGWRSGRNYFRYAGGTATDRVSGPKDKVFGVSGVILPKNSVNATQYWNGTPTSHASRNYTIASNQRFIIGSLNNSTGYPFLGDVQEIIVYDAANNVDINAIDLRRIQSYLSVKYGISMDTIYHPNYESSDGTEFWTGSANEGYRNNIFGLGRDDASGLYQKQSRSTNDNQMEVYIAGSTLEPLNVDNTGTLNDNTFLVLGDNDEEGTNAYYQSINTAFVNGTNNFLITDISNRVWKAQVTNEASFTVNIRLSIGSNENYVLVSSNNTFTPVSTRIYPVEDLIAENVLIENGDYIAYASISGGPGNVSDGLNIWMRADMGVTHDNGTIIQWSDAGPFKRVPEAINEPTYIESAVNFNPTVSFDRTQNQVFRWENFTSGFSQGEIFYSIKSDRQSNQQNGFHLWGNSGEGAGINSHYTWSNGVIYDAFGSNSRKIFTPSWDITEYNIYNTMAKAGTWTAWRNGEQAFSSGNTVRFVGNITELGFSQNGHYFSGEVPEVILYNRELTQQEKDRVNTYLAIKYGYVLPTNYLSSDGSVIYDVSDYEHGIVGIGREDISGLYQKQAVSLEDSSIIISKGNLENSNSENENFIEDGSYLILGNNAEGGFDLYEQTASTTYTNGSLSEDIYFITSKKWRASVTGVSSFTVNINIPESFSPRVLYVLVSSSPSFDPATTALYPVNDFVAENVEIEDGDFLTFVLEINAPGGVATGLLAWYMQHPDNTNDVWRDAFDLNDANSAATAPVYNTSGSDLINFNHSYTFTNGRMHAPSEVTVGGSAELSYTFFGISQLKTTSERRVFSSTTGNKLFGHWSGNENSLYIENNPGQHTTSYSGVISNTTNLNLFSLTRAPSSGAVALRKNGTVVNSSGSSNSSSWTPSIGGSGNFTGENSNVMVPEFIVYDTNLDAGELTRVESYIAIKYGITLDTIDQPNYVLSNSEIVWTGTNNTGYRQNIFGVGRDNLATLYQKQSKSATDEWMILSKGDFANSNDENNGEIENHEFLMLGNNGLFGFQTYAYAENTTFANGDIIQELNNRTNRIWKAQVTNIDSFEVNIKVGLGDYVLYVLVSNSSDFTPANTRIYEVNDQLAENVKIADGEYITYAMYLVTPGGVASDLRVWLKADNTFTEGVWIDNSVSGNDFIQPNTARRANLLNSGADFNYNSYLNFELNDHYYIPNGRPFTVDAPEGQTSFSIFNIYQGDNSNPYFFGFGGTNPTAAATRYPAIGVVNQLPRVLNEGAGTTNNNGAIQYTLGEVSFLRTTTERNPGALVFGFNGNNDVRGVSSDFSDGFRMNQGATIGGASASGRQYEGYLPEVIMYERSLTANEVSRVESYVAIKYGITLDTLDQPDYLISDNTEVFTGASNTGYRNHIFGVGKDRESGFFQKQSVSETDKLMILSLGELANSNEENNAQLDDKVFLMLGNNNEDGVTLYTQASSTSFANGQNTEEMNFRTSKVWKAQVTNTDSFEVNINIQLGSSLLYVLVSNSPDFDPADTRIYEVENKVAENVKIADGEFIAYGLYMCAPGGVINRMRVWLKSDDSFSGSLWMDHSINGNNFLQPNENLRPVKLDASPEYNFNPYVFFSPEQAMYVNDGRPFSEATPADGHSSYLVFNRDASSYARPYLFGFGSNNINTDAARRPGIGLWDDRARLYNLGSGTSDNITPTSFTHTPGKVNFYGITVEPGEFFFEFDGRKQQGGGNASVGTDFSMNQGAVIGRVGTLRLYEGGLPEIVMYEEVLSPEDEEKVRTYFAIKYGITMDVNPSDTTENSDYVLSDGTVIWNGNDELYMDYHNNIAAIAIDRIACLAQKQSRSVNTELGLEMSLDTEFKNSNLDNEGEFTEDLTALAWGWNGEFGWEDQPEPEEDCYVPPTIDKRSNFKYLVKETGDVNEVLVRLHRDNFISIDIENMPFYMIVADDQDLETNLTYVEGDLNGDYAEFSYNFAANSIKYIGFEGSDSLSIAGCIACQGGMQYVNPGRAYGYLTSSDPEISNNRLGIMATGGMEGEELMIDFRMIESEPGLEYRPNRFPRRYGKWLRMRRRDPLPFTPDKSIIFSTALSKAAKPSFEIAGVSRNFSSFVKIVIKAYCGGNEIQDAYSLNYKAPAGNRRDRLNRYVINENPLEAEAIRPLWNLSRYSTMIVDFSANVDSFTVEWTQLPRRNRRRIKSLFIGPMSFECVKPKEFKCFNDDGIDFDLYFSTDSVFSTCDTTGMVLRFTNVGCDPKTIDLDLPLPAFLHFVDSSLVNDQLPSGTVNDFGTEDRLVINGLEIPVGSHKMFIDVYSSASDDEEFAVQGTYEMVGGNEPTYYSDNLNAEVGCNPTKISFTYTEIPDMATIESIVVKNTVTNDSTYLPASSGFGDTLVYTVTFNNPTPDPISGLIFEHQAEEFSEYFVAPGSLVLGPGVTGTPNNYGVGDDESFLVIDDLTLPPGFSTINFSVTTMTSDTIILSTMFLELEDIDCLSGGSVEDSVKIYPLCTRGGILVPFDETVDATLDTCRQNNWLYHKDDENRAVLAIYPNSNDWEASSVIVDATAFDNKRTNGVDSSIVFQRTFTVKHGTLVEPVKVRLYYDQDEFNTHVPTVAYPTQGWFKHETDRTGIETDLLPEWLLLTRSEELIPDSSGLEFGVAFVEFHNITEFSTFGYLGTTSDQLLPVSWLDFKVTRNDKTAVLDWSTATEINNQKFEILHSLDGLHFGVIGELPGSGNSSFVNEYQFVHEAPSLGVNYYKIRQVDYDGTFSYSHIRSLKFDRDESYDTKLYPNPFTNMMTIESEGLIKHLGVFDAQGKQLFFEPNIEDYRTDIQLGYLASGVYFVRVEFDNGTHQYHRIVRQ